MSINSFVEDGASQFGELVPVSPINPAAPTNPHALSFDPSSWPLPVEYLLGTVDHPGLVLTTIPVKPKNYRPWSQGILNFIKAKGKLGFISGSIPKPVVQSREYYAWIKNDAMLVAWIRIPCHKKDFAFCSCSSLLENSSTRHQQCIFVWEA